MLRFKTYIVEADKKPLTPEQAKTLLKSYINTSVVNSGIALTSSSRGGPHVRFPIVGDGKEFFKTLGLKVSDYKEKRVITSKYKTYVLTATKNIIGNPLAKEPKTIPKGTSYYWVNSEISQTAGGGQMFANKALSPDSLNLSGQTFAKGQLRKAVKEQLKIKFPEGDTAKVLTELAELAWTDKTSVPLADLSFDKKDFAKISSDFGEVLSAIWVMKSKNFSQVLFPSASNEKLIDFYGIKVGRQYPFSVKSGATGGKVTVKNIVRAIKQRAKTANADNSHELADEVFHIVQSFSMKEQMIMLHQKFKTKCIRELASLMKCKPNDITLDRIDQWTTQENTVKRDVWEKKGKKKIRVEKKGDLSKDNHLLLKKLGKWHKKWSPPEDKTKYTKDLPRQIISPLGQVIYKELNKMDGMKDSLTRIAQQVTLIQVNVNVKTKVMTFKSNFFKQADFQFEWAGYSGGNTLGFVMKMKK